MDTFRLQVREQELFLDEVITATGFDGIEDTDWSAVHSWTLNRPTIESVYISEAETIVIVFSEDMDLDVVDPSNFTLDSDGAALTMDFITDPVALGPDSTVSISLSREVSPVETITLSYNGGTWDSYDTGYPLWYYTDLAVDNQVVTTSTTSTSSTSTYTTSTSTTSTSSTSTSSTSSTSTSTTSTSSTSSSSRTSSSTSTTSTSSTSSSSTSTSTTTTTLLEYEDDFESYVVNQDLRDQANWTSARGEDIQIINDDGDKVFTGHTDYYAFAYYDDTFADDQWSQITVDSITADSQYIGVIVRMNAGSELYYGWMGNQSQSYLRLIYQGGTAATFATGDGWAATDVIRLEVEGYELRCYKNGILDTSIDTDGKYTVTTEAHQVASGNAGVMTYAEGNACYGDDWSGGNL